MILKMRDSEGKVQDIIVIKGEDYILTPADKGDIAAVVADMLRDSGNVDRFIEATPASVNLHTATKIKNSAFYCDLGLESIHMPCVTAIGEYAFSGCENLASATLSENLKSIAYGAFYECGLLALDSLPESVETIGDSAFYYCSSITFKKLPNGIKTIGSNMFSRCTNLALASFPSALEKIGAYAFQNCAKLAVTRIPASVTEIGNRAFQGCTGLTAITFDGKPTTISNNAFESCTNLLTINVPWASGEVANAPWGATDATINYNYAG